MKFQLNEKVRVKSTARTGVIIKYNYEVYIVNGKKKEDIKYYVMQDGFGYARVFPEEDLESFFQFTDAFEKGLIDLMIDVNLKERNFDMVEELYNQKQQYIK